MGAVPMANINGTDADETLTGTDGDDVINQRTAPRSGSDIVRAGGGNDVVYRGTGSNDSGQVTDLDAGAGNDTVRYSIDNVTGFNSVLLGGGDGDDTFTVVNSHGPAPAHRPTASLRSAAAPGTTSSR